MAAMKPMSATVFVRLGDSDVMNELGTAELPLRGSRPLRSPDPRSLTATYEVAVDWSALAELLRAVADALPAEGEEDPHAGEHVDHGGWEDH